MLEKVMKIVEAHNLPFYVEHNDFVSGGLSFLQEIEDLQNDDEIFPEDVIVAINKKSIWSARFNYGGTKVVYAGSFERVIELIHAKLRDKFYGV